MFLGMFCFLSFSDELNKIKTGRPSAVPSNSTKSFFSRLKIFSYLVKLSAFVQAR